MGWRCFSAGGLTVSNFATLITFRHIVLAFRQTAPKGDMQVALEACEVARPHLELFFLLHVSLTLFCRLTTRSCRSAVVSSAPHLFQADSSGFQADRLEARQEALAMREWTCLA